MRLHSGCADEGSGALGADMNVESQTVDGAIAMCDERKGCPQKRDGGLVAEELIGSQPRRIHLRASSACFRLPLVYIVVDEGCETLGVAHPAERCLEIGTPQPAAADPGGDGILNREPGSESFG